MAPRSRLTVDEASAGRRLDAFLAAAGAAPSVARARALLATGVVRVDGRPARKGVRLRAGQTVDVEAVPSGPAAPAPSPEVPLVVLYEDADLIAVDKPAGVPSHPLAPGESGTLAGALVARFPECAAASEDPREGGLGHRLDRGTSGVLLAARSRAAWHALRAALGAPDCEKVYRAEVLGEPRSAPAAGGDPYLAAGAEPDAVVVLAPIGRVGRRGAAVRLGAGRGLLPARTEVRVLERRQGTTLVEARLGKGRAHQVRAHLAYLGAPVVGDQTYGAAAAPSGAALRLHAARVSLRHPSTGEPLVVEAPLPGWARAAGA